MTKTIVRPLVASFLLTLLQFAPMHFGWLMPHLRAVRFGLVSGAWARSTLNVKTFGARGDGITNDSAAIAAALTAARDGDIVYFPAGVYLCNDVSLSGKNNLTLNGKGDASIIRNGITDGTNPIFTFANVSGLTIKNLAFDNRAIRSYGGVRFYDTENVIIDHTHFYDSSPLALGSTDRYAYVFANGIQPHRNIQITNNLIEDLQLEVDFGYGVTIGRNTVKRGVRTGAIGLFTVDDGVTLQDYSIDSNTVIDPVGAGIALNVDPPDNNNAAFRNIAITNNKIIFNRIPTEAIHAGPADSSTSSTGNIYDGVIIRNNVIQIAASAGAQREDSALIKFNAGPNSMLSFMNTVVDQNQILGGDNTALSIVAMDLRYLANSTVTGNAVSKTFASLAFNRLLNTRIEQNYVAQITNHPPYTIDNSSGGILFQSNYYSGPVTIPLEYQNGSGTDVIHPPTVWTQTSKGLRSLRSVTKILTRR